MVEERVLTTGFELWASQWDSLKETVMVEWTDLSKVEQMDDCVADMMDEISVVNSEKM